MFEVACIVGPVFLALGLWDKRARPMALLLVFVWLGATLIDASASVDVAVALKPVVDFVGGVMALSLIARERWSLMVPALFCLMLLLHAGYWICWHNGIDLWYAYAHALTVLWVIQTACVAWPSGGRIIGLASSYFGSRLSSRGAMALRRSMGARDGSSDQESL